MKITTPWMLHDDYDFFCENYGGFTLCRKAFCRFFPEATQYSRVKVVATTTYRTGAKAIVLKGVANKKEEWGFIPDSTNTSINYSMPGSKRQKRIFADNVGAWIKKRYPSLTKRLFSGDKKVKLWITLEIK